MWVRLYWYMNVYRHVFGGWYGTEKYSWKDMQSMQEKEITRGERIPQKKDRKEGNREVRIKVEPTIL